MKIFSTLAPLSAGLLLLAQPLQAANILDVYQLAKVNDAELRAARFNFEATLESKPLARSALLPQIGLEAGRSQVDTDTPSGDTDYGETNLALTLSQTLYRQEQSVQVDQADLEIARAQAEFEGIEQGLITKVAERYFNVLGAEDSLEFALAEKEAIFQQLEQAQKRYEVGLIAVTDVKEAQARYDLAVAQEIAAGNQLAIAREALRVITGDYLSDLAALVEETPLIAPDPEDSEAWVKLSEEQNRSYTAIRFATQLAQKQIERSRAGDTPSVDLLARHAYRDTDGGFSEGETTTTSLTVQLNFPLYTGSRTGSQIRQAQASFSAAKENQEQQRRTVAQQTRDAYLGVIAGISRVKALKQALISTQAGAEATRAGFDVGTRTAVEVLVALRETYLAQRDYARSRYDYVLNHLRLKQAAGTLSKADLEILNQYLQ